MRHGRHQYPAGAREVNSDENTKRTHFSSEPAQIETSCMLSDEAVRPVRRPANSTLAFEWTRLGGADAQVRERMGEKKSGSAVTISTGAENILETEA